MHPRSEGSAGDMDDLEWALERRLAPRLGGGHRDRESAWSEEDTDDSEATVIVGGPELAPLLEGWAATAKPSAGSAAGEAAAGRVGRIPVGRAPAQRAPVGGAAAGLRQRAGRLGSAPWPDPTPGERAGGAAADAAEAPTSPGQRAPAIQRGRRADPAPVAQGGPRGDAAGLPLARKGPPSPGAARDRAIPPAAREEGAPSLRPWGGPAPHVPAAVGAWWALWREPIQWGALALISGLFGLVLGLLLG